MSRPVLFIVTLLVLMAGSLYYELAWPPTVYKRAAQTFLDSLSTAVNGMTAGTIDLALDKSFHEPAKILLEIGFPVLHGQKAKNVTAEQFNKTEFLHFVDNVIYPMQHYEIKSTIDSIRLSSDKKTGTLIFTSEASALGMQMDAGMPFKVRSLCSADMIFAGLQSMQISQLSCVTQIHYGAASEP